MKVAERERALLRLVEEWREQECRRLIAEAQQRAAALRRRAFAREREALHQRVMAERSRAQGLIQSARAERATRERRRSEQGDAQVIAAVWPRLRERLQARWDAAESRGEWVEGALEQALERLPPREWMIRHPPAWPQPEQTRLADAVVQRSGHRPMLEPVAGLTAGLVIAGPGAVLDTSLEGLLQDRARIDARVLALWKWRGARAERRGAGGAASSGEGGP